MSTTTPSEFLQFAKDMGLDRLPSTGTVPITDETHPSQLTGLAVLNNICHLIEHLHDLKMENNRLRAHLDLVNHVDRFLLRTPDHESKPLLRSTLSIHGEGTYDEEKSSTTLSPSSSLKIRKFSANSFSISSKDRQGIDPVNHLEESSSFLPMDELTNSPLGLSGQSNWHNWSKVRHALRFSLRRKKSPDSSSFRHVERPIPAISISLESDDDHLQEEKRSKTMKKKKKKTTTSTNLSPLDDYQRRAFHADETDQDDESIRSEHKRNIYAQHDSTYSSSHERANLSASTTLMNDDESSSFTRKQSKIAHYRHKIRSKLDTVKKQFSEQMPLSRQHGSTFDEIGAGLNHAVLSAKLAPAMTKSYQQKMREWQTLQKSDFLVSYRRQSISNEIRRPSIASIHADPLQSPVSLPLSTVDLMELSPILSPNQRSLIVHQWREIMSEELTIRRKQDFLQEKLLHLKRLENNLKQLKTRIFSSNDEEYFLKHRSMTSIEQLERDFGGDSFTVLRRCRSLHAFVSMPASWILAVQSAAYSDVLDGTSTKTTERALMFNRNFFHHFKHLQDEREQFEQSLINDLPSISPDKTNLPSKGNSKVINRACLRKLSFSSSNPITYDVSPMPMHPTICTLSPIDRLATPTTSEPEPISLDSSLSAIGMLNKRSKRSRFDLKKTLQRSKSMCVTQFHSWLQRRRQQHHSAELRRKSAVESKASKEARTSPMSTPTLLGSPRLARLRQRIFKAPHPPPPSPVIPEHVELPSLFADDSDVQFAQRECPVRIYLPARSSPSIRHVRIVELDLLHQQQLPTPPMSKITSPIIHRRTPSTAKERRESFAVMSNIFHPT